MTTMDKLNATLGVDMNAATHEQLAKRVFEYCGEMADCYDPETLECEAFQAIQMAMLIMNEGRFNDGNSDL